jgi:hypothetical protein
VEGDFTDSTVFKWGFLVLPVIALLGSIALRYVSPLAWAAALIAPPMAWVFVGGFVLFDPEHGASFWLVTEVMLLLCAAFVAAAAGIGGAVSKTLRPNLRRSSCDHG